MSNGQKDTYCNKQQIQQINSNSHLIILILTRPISHPNPNIAYPNLLPNPTPTPSPYLPLPLIPLPSPYPSP